MVSVVLSTIYYFGLMKIYSDWGCRGGVVMFFGGSWGFFGVIGVVGVLGVNDGVCPHRRPAISKSKTLHQHRCTTQIHECMPHLSASSMCVRQCIDVSGACTCAGGGDF